MFNQLILFHNSVMIVVKSLLCSRYISLIDRFINFSCINLHCADWNFTFIYNTYLTRTYMIYIYIYIYIYISRRNNINVIKNIH